MKNHVVKVTSHSSIFNLTNGNFSETGKHNFQQFKTKVKTKINEEKMSLLLFDEILLQTRFLSGQHRYSVRNDYGLDFRDLGHDVPRSPGRPSSRSNPQLEFFGASGD